MKHLILALALIAGTAQAEDALVHDAYTAAGRDIGSTAIGLAAGLSEANPLGLLTIPLHAVAIEMSDKQPEPQRTNDLTTITSVWDGVALFNVVTLLGGPITVALAVGTAYLAHSYTATQPLLDEAVKRTDFALQCAQFLAQGPGRSCEYTKH